MRFDDITETTVFSAVVFVTLWAELSNSNPLTYFRRVDVKYARTISLQTPRRFMVIFRGHVQADNGKYPLQ